MLLVNDWGVKTFCGNTDTNPKRWKYSAFSTWSPLEFPFGKGINMHGIFKLNISKILLEPALETQSEHTE